MHRLHQKSMLVLISQCHVDGTDKEPGCSPLKVLMQHDWRGSWPIKNEKYISNMNIKPQVKIITARDNGSLIDSLKSATRILVGSALTPAPVADKTFRPFRTHAARSATYYTW